MQEWLDRLERWLGAGRPSFLRALNACADENQFAEVEALAGTSLPDSFKALYIWHDGQSEDSFDALQFNRTFMCLDEILDAMEGLNELDEAGKLSSPMWWRKKWVPFLDNGGGDHLCLDLEGSFDGKPGQLIEFWHDDAERTIVAGSLEEWFRTFVISLEANLWEDEDGDLQPVDEDDLEDFMASHLSGYPIERSADAK